MGSSTIGTVAKQLEKKSEQATRNDKVEWIAQIEKKIKRALCANHNAKNVPKVIIDKAILKTIMDDFT